jgi:hypothetical protein
MAGEAFVLNSDEDISVGCRPPICPTAAPTPMQHCFRQAESTRREWDTGFT